MVAPLPVHKFGTTPVLDMSCDLKHVISFSPCRHLVYKCAAELQNSLAEFQQFWF